MGPLAQAIETLTGPLGVALSLRKNVHSLQEKVKSLEICRRELLERMEEAQRQGQQAVQLVQWWLGEVDDLHQNCDQIDSDGKKLFRLDVWSRYWISRRALDKVDVARDLQSTVQAFLMMVAMEEGKASYAEIAMAGAESTFRQLRDCVQLDEGGIFGLHGMGGVGKTMMLHRLKNELGRDFDAVAMVEVSEDYKEEEIQAQIAVQLGLQFAEKESKRARRCRLYDHINNGKKLLIILDDVWDYIDLYSIGIPEPNILSKFKILVATRIAKVCTSMRVKKTIDMNCLPKQDAWDLFSDVVGKEFINSDPAIKAHATAIARRCDGLPLALRTVGLAMASKRTREEWEIARMDPSTILDMDNKIFQCLKRSYDRLASDDELRRCFLHLSLFPEARLMDKRALAEVFVKHGVLKLEDGGGEEAYLKALDIISRLRSVCMLEIETGFYGQDRVKMHAMVRSLSLWIESGRTLVQAGTGDCVDVADVSMWSDAEVVSVMDNGVVALPAKPACGKLDTLLLVGNRFMNTVPDGFFINMPLLRVLDLSWTPLEELPAHISRCANLQYLNICHTKLRSLPYGLGDLNKLKYLDISHTARLQTIPQGVISRLSMMQVLNASPYGYGDWAAVDGVPMDELEGLHRLRSLGITIKTNSSLELLSSSARLAGAVEGLHLSRLEGVRAIGLPTPTLGPHMKRLKRLKIYSCSEVNEITISGGNSGGDSKLEYLELWCIERLRGIVFDGPRAAGQFLHRLRELRIYRCGIEQVVGAGVDLVLPNLHCLYLGDLQDLRSICREMTTLPRLKFLGVYRCPNLRRLPRGMGACRSMRHVCGQREWWDGLEWEDQGERSALEALLNLHQRH